MHRKTYRALVGLAAALALFVMAPVGAKAQSGDDQASLTLKDVKERLRENRQHLQDAKKRGKAGDAQGLETALTNFERGTEGLNRAMDEGGFQGTDAEREKALDRVEKATSKHTAVLTDLLNKVPEQARPHIQHAIEVSQKGHNTALANLGRVRTQRQERLAAEQARQTGGYGRQEGRGQPGGGRGPGGTGGRPGGGPPAGNPGGRGPH